ncbi:hypothetical protein SUGI_0220340 [Cryptomeria japonica]|nr:hypothetical protein SUGI_0220340 [Cryptomeria japonica]
MVRARTLGLPLLEKWQAPRNATAHAVGESGAPLMLQGDEGLWELGDFIGSSLSLEVASIEVLVSSSYNVVAV